MQSHYYGQRKQSVGIGGMILSITKSLKSNSSKNVPVQINATVVGGGQNQQILIQHLKTGPLPSRATAAASIIESIEKYSISSVAEIWYLARDMCSHKLQSNIRRTSINLLIQCIKKDDGAVSNRLMYFKDIIGFCHIGQNGVDPEFDLFLKALFALTNDGRQIYDYWIFDEEKNLRTFLEASLSILGNNTKALRSSSLVEESKSDSNYENLLGIMNFIRNCFMYNYSFFDGNTVSSLISKTIKIGMKIQDQNIQSKTLEILHHCILSGNMPYDTMEETIQYICFVGYEGGELMDQGWESIQTLCLEYSPSLTVMFLCNNITKSNIRDTDYSPSSLLSSLGSMHFIEKILSFQATQKDSEIDVIFSPILRAMIIAARYDIEEINAGLLKFLKNLFAKDFVKDFGDADVLGRLFPFNIWYSKSNSIFDLLKAIHLRSKEDSENMTLLCNSLKELFINHNLIIPRDKLVDFFISNYKILPQDSAKFVLRYYEEEKLCSPLRTLWYEDSFRLMNYFYFGSQNTEIRISCLQVIRNSFSISYIVLEEKDLNHDLLFDLLRKSIHEKDVRLMDYLMETFLRDLSLNCPDRVYKDICTFFKSKVLPKESYTEGVIGFVYPSSITQVDTSLPAIFLERIAKFAANIFSTSILKNSYKASQSFDLLIAICNYALITEDESLLLIASRCLVRIRATNESFVFLTNPTDMDGLSSSFKRNKLSSDFTRIDHKWEYPEKIEYLNEKSFEKISKTLRIAANVSDSSSDIIAITDWFSIVLKIMNKFIGWDIYSFIWAHFCSQLSNISLFQEEKEKIIELRHILCEQLTLNLPPLLKLPGDMIKADIQVAHIRTMSALIGYHDLFSRQDENDIISSLIFALSSWEKTAIPSINILSACCYEIPVAIKKFSSVILTKLQTRVTSAFASSHTLEFLMSLVNVSSLTSNFTIDEYKTVFAIAFKYIQYFNDIKKRAPKDSTSHAQVQTHGVDAEVDQTPTTTSTEITPILSQYVLSLSYNIISSWFLTLNLTNRKSVSSFLIRNLILSSENEKVLDERTISHLDLVARFTYSDIPLKIFAPHSTSSETCSTKSWVVGNSIISIETDTLTSVSKIIIRRPTGVTSMQIKLDNVKPNNHTIIDPNYFLLQLFNHLEEGNNTKPLPVINDTITLRAISMIDRIPSVEFHKIGIIYVGPNQSTEQEVLGNQVGSRAYHDLLSKIGRLIKLNGCKEYYVGVLDIESDTDGKYALFWDNKTTQVVFHTTTMMKGSIDDKFYNLKKRHIGNNYVNIYFDESTLPFNFNLIKSQFTFMNIVITPHSISTSIDGYTSKRVFKVKLFRRFGIPGVFSACHFKIIAEHNLATYVRNLAIMADRFANVWHSTEGGTYLSNWAHRVKQISAIKEKCLQNHAHLQEESQRLAPAGTGVPASTTESFLKQLDFDSASFSHISDVKYEYIAPGETNPKYNFYEFNSYTT